MKSLTNEDVNDNLISYMRKNEKSGVKMGGA